MHPEEAAFLEAIAENIDDDVSRLVLADWYEEHDDFEKADAIREGVANPRRHLEMPHHSAVIQFHSPRPGGSGYAWLARGYEGVSWATYKGLIEYAVCPFNRWCEIGHHLLEKNWCPEIVIPDVAVKDDLNSPAGFVLNQCQVDQDALNRMKDWSQFIRQWPQVKRWNWARRVVYKRDRRQIGDHVEYKVADETKTGILATPLPELTIDPSLENWIVMAAVKTL